MKNGSRVQFKGVGLKRHWVQLVDENRFIHIITLVFLYCLYQIDISSTVDTDSYETSICSNSRTHCKKVVIIWPLFLIAVSDPRSCIVLHSTPFSMISWANLSVKLLPSSSLRMISGGVLR